MFAVGKVRVGRAGWRRGPPTGAHRSRAHPSRPRSVRGRRTRSARGRRSHRRTGTPAARDRRAENDLKHVRTQTHVQTTRARAQTPRAAGEPVKKRRGGTKTTLFWAGRGNLEGLQLKLIKLRLRIYPTILVYVSA